MTQLGRHITSPHRTVTHACEYAYAVRVWNIHIYRYMYRVHMSHARICIDKCARIRGVCMCILYICSYIYIDAHKHTPVQVTGTAGVNTSASGDDTVPGKDAAAVGVAGKTEENEDEEDDEDEDEDDDNDENKNDDDDDNDDDDGEEDNADEEQDEEDGDDDDDNEFYYLGEDDDDELKEEDEEVHIFFNPDGDFVYEEGTYTLRRYTRANTKTRMR